MRARASFADAREHQIVRWMSCLTLLVLSCGATVAAEPAPLQQVDTIAMPAQYQPPMHPQAIQPNGTATYAPISQHSQEILDAGNFVAGAPSATQGGGNYNPQAYTAAPQPAPSVANYGSLHPRTAMAPPVTGAMPAGIEQQAVSPAGSYPTQLASAQTQIPQPGGPVPQSDILGRLEAAEAELNSLRQKLVPEERIAALEAADKKLAEKPLPLVRLSGFFQYDTGWFSQDSNSKDVLGNIQNGTGFRRTRLQGLGQLTEFTTFSIEMDFAFPGRPSFMDVWGEQSNIPIVGHARIGQYRQPVTMDSWTNIKHLEFLERSAPFIALDPFRRVGIMGWDMTEDERTMWAYSLFGTGVTFWNGVANVYNTEGNDNRFGTQIGDSGGIAFATRGTHLLYYDPHANNRYLMHIGGGYLFGELGGEGTTGPFAKAFEARTFPEFFVGDQAGGFLTAAGTPNVVDTGRFLATNYQMLHAEIAGSYGPAHFQAEYLAQFVNQRGGGIVFLDGGYIQGGYFLTGENTGYNKLMGAMDYNVKPNSEFFGIGRKKPLCGWGAWELAARWSWLDLSSTKIRAENYVPGQTVAPTVVPPPIINPGVLNEPTIALNWWWNQYMRVQFNYIYSMVNSNNSGLYTTSIYGLRFQTEF